MCKFLKQKQELKIRFWLEFGELLFYDPKLTTLTKFYFPFYFDFWLLETAESAKKQFLLPPIYH